MSSPFPGMDPYLERHWRDVHTKLVTYAGDALNEQLPDDLIAFVEESLSVEVDASRGESNGYSRPVTPDVAVYGVIDHLGAEASANGGVALAPYRLNTSNEPRTDRFIEIVDVSGDGGKRIVTVIEFVSPTNKMDGLKAFQKKRHESLAAGVNVVEIDLVWAGDWRRLLNCTYPRGAEAEYRAVMWRAGNPPEAYLHPFPLHAPLPTIKIPLRAGERPSELALQPLIAQLYRKVRYGRVLDYSRPCDPPLPPEQAAWAAELVQKFSQRRSEASSEGGPDAE